MAKAITGKPRKAYNVSPPTRDDNSNTYRIKFNYGGDIKDENNPARAEKFYEYWRIGIRQVEGTGKKEYVFKSVQEDVAKTEGWIVLTDFSKFVEQSTHETWALTDFYPHTGGKAPDWAIDYIKISHQAWNRKGFGPGFHATRDIIRANEPTVSELEQDEETGIVSCTVEADEKNRQSADRYDTITTLTVEDTHTGTTTTSTTTWTDDEKEITYNVTDRMALTYDEYVRLTVTAKSRGFGGPSSTASRTLYVSWPLVPTVVGVDVSTVDAAITPESKVTVRLAKRNASKEHPTTNMQLEILSNVDYETAADIPGDAKWEKTGVQDDGECTALSTTVAELMPDRGKRSWVRVKVWNQLEGIFYRYSEPQRITDLERPAPSATSNIAITEAIAGDDGASARLTICWDNDDATGTEVSWSADVNAWRSTNGPTTHTFDWDDGPLVVGTKTWAHHTTLYVAGLTGGTRYDFRARRYLDGETTTYGGYCTDVYVTPAVAPGSVTLAAPAFVAEGSDLSVTWTYDGGGTQTEWHLMAGTPIDVTEVVDGETRTRQRLDPTTVRDAGNGTDARGTQTIAWERLALLAGGSGSVSLAVSVSTGGQSVESDAVNVGIARRPTISVTGVPDVLTAQPLAIAVTDATGGGARFRVDAVCRSSGASRTTPGGTEWQSEGDVVWSDSQMWDRTYSWKYGEYVVGYNYVARKIERHYFYERIDDGTRSVDGDLWDYGEYVMEVTATNEDTGLTSETWTKPFRVDYARKAPDPSGAVEIVAYDETDVDGVRSICAEVTLAAPEDAIEGDLMELWRVTPNGNYLVADGIAPGTTVTDPWAPYGTSARLAYAVAVRTVDGCVAWQEYPYELAGAHLRVDFDGTYVELPYNLELSDEWQKDFEGRKHLDGTVGGYWGAGAEHKASISTDTIPVDDPETARALHALALHAGPCFVRTPDGCAYEADVQLTPIRREGAGIASVSLDATEVALTEEYMAVSPYTNEAPEDEEEEE